ncbi:hypothetical protein BVX98_04675 [bacterium F11]|nr:hypothetical protein BVX98_04675 [bacterium F11]
MPRPKRLFSPDMAYHIISRGNNRQPLFRQSHDFDLYLEFLGSLKKEYSYQLYHYCLMTNHVHLLMRFHTFHAFQKVPQRLNLLYAKHVHRAYGHVGHVFQDRFKSLPVTDNTYLLECGRYIERNPLQAGLVDQPEDYRWSSHAFYRLGRPNPLITSNPMVLDLAHSEEQRKVLYGVYVSTDRPYDHVVEKALLGKLRFL